MSNILVWITIVGPLIYCVLVILAGFLHPGYSHFAQSVSKLVFEPYGWIQTLNFFLSGLVVVALAFRFRLEFPKKRCFLVVFIMMIIIGLTQFWVGWFETDPQGGLVTLSSTIHHISADIGVMLFVFVCFLVIPTLKSNSFRGLIIYTIIAGTVALLLEISWVMKIHFNFIRPEFGIYERVVLANTLVWIEVMALRLWVWHRGKSPIKQ